VRTNQFMMVFMAQKQRLPDLSTLKDSEKDTLILSLFARLEALESLVRKDSHNPKNLS
jgi:transposase